MALVTSMAYNVRDGMSSYMEHYALYHGRSQPLQPDITAPRVGYSNPYTSTYAPVSQHATTDFHRHATPRSSHSRGSTGSEDGSKPSLPSISNLLDIAQGDRSHDIHAEASSRFNRSPPHYTTTTQPEAVGFATVQSSRDRSRSPTTALPPPPPPLRNDSVLAGAPSPSTISTGSSLSSYPYVTAPHAHHAELIDHRTTHDHLFKPQPLPSQPSISTYALPRYTSSTYTNSPTTISSHSNSSFYSPNASSYPLGSGLAHQRPLPSNFPPPLIVHSTPELGSHPPRTPGSATPTSLVGGNGSGSLWAHHHYISASSQASYPQSPDRYICPTCSKAFSRPSSLKIHTHSHTGEKPFRCPHAGCGKAFSVRSNMKRHERGCHSAMTNGYLQQHAHLL